MAFGYPRGGGQIIADRLAQVIEANGGSVHLRKPIAEVMVEGGRAVGVRTETDRHGVCHEIRANTVLSNADIKQTFQRLVPAEHLPSEMPAKVEQMKMGGAIFMTFLGIKADLEALGMRNSNYWQFDDYDSEAYYRESRHVGEPRVHGCYITSATLKDPGTRGHAPEGVHSVEVMTLVPGESEAWGVPSNEVLSWQYKRSERYQVLKEKIESDLVNRLESVFPGTRDAIVYKESATPVTHTRFTRASAGTGYGLACTPDQFMDNRPGYRTPLKGLYLCGASTRAGHGVVGSMMSGKHAAHCIASDIGKALQ